MHRPDDAPDRPSGSARAVLALLARLPQGALSRGFGLLADLPLPGPLREPVLGTFAQVVGADVSEAELPLDAYGSLNEFFTRKLRPGVRRWPQSPAVVGSPVDGTTGQLGRISEGQGIQAKGRSYSIAGLLDSEEAAEHYEGGSFLTIYLSPRDYHRIHAPCDGVIREARHVPGALLPVNIPAVAHVPELFPRNERLVCYLEGPLGRVAVVAVGAYNVGRISAAWDPLWNSSDGEAGWVTNRPGATPATRRYEPPVRMRRGDELMTFHLGSTVVLLFEPGHVEVRPDLHPEQPVRLGEALARGTGSGSTSDELPDEEAG